MSRATGGVLAGGGGLLLAAVLAYSIVAEDVTGDNPRGPSEWGVGPAAGTQELPPGVTPEMVERGREIFLGAGHCYTCHGRDGGGKEDLGADLTDREWAHGDGTYEYLVNRIQRGVSAQDASTGVPMPPTGGADLSEAQVEAVAAYVWTLSRGSPGGDP